MDLKSLKDKGGIVSSALVPKEVTWKHTDDAGEEQEDTFTIHVRKASFGTMEKLFVGNDDQSKSAALISQSVLLDGGKEALSYEDAFQLDPSLAAVLMKAVNEVNARKNSLPPMKSGTN